MDLLKPFRKMGRPKHEPHRQSEIYPRMVQLGQQPRQRANQLAYKPTPRNLRYFCATPYARRCINAYKNTITQLDWEIVVKPGMAVSDELLRQMEVVQNCFDHPNNDDSFSQLLEQVVEDMMVGAGALEQQIGGDPLRPLWLWPVDGLSIQIYPLWDGTGDRYVQMLGYGQASGSTPAASFTNEELIYIRPNPTTASPFGLGPIEVAFNTISRLLGVGSYAGNLTSNASPQGFLHLGDVGDEHIAAFRQYWKNDIEGQGRMPISGGGDKPPTFLALHPEGDNAVYLKYQDFLKRECSIACDLSPQNLGIEHDINRNTAEVAEDRDMAQAIGPFARKLQKSLSREAIQERLGFSGLEFRFKGLDHEDELEAANVFDKEYKNNAVTPNEYRARRGHPPMQSAWGDLTFADFQIAVSASRGAGALADPEKTLYDDGPSDPNVVVRETKTQSETKDLTPGGQKRPAGSDRIDTSLPGRTTKRGSGQNKTKLPKK